MTESNNISTFFDKFIDKWCSKNDEKTIFKDELMQVFYDSNKELAKYNIENGVVSSFETKQEKMLQKICDQLDKLEIEKKNETKKTNNLGNFASASAKKLADNNSLNEEDLEGTGSNGKITVKDIRLHLPDNKKNKKVEKKQEKHPCSGVKKNGDPCGRNGNNYMDNLDQWFCHSHKGEINSTEDVTDEIVSDIESIKDGDIPYKSDNEILSDFDE